MSREGSANPADRKKLRKATEDFIPDLTKSAQLANFNFITKLIHFQGITEEWNTSFEKDLKAVQKYTFKTEFPRLPSYKDIEEIRKKFEPAKLVNSDKFKTSSFEKSNFVLVRVEQEDDVHKVS